MHIDRTVIVAGRQPFLGVDFDAIDMSQTLASIQSASRRGAFSYIVTPNVDHVIRLTEESAYKRRFNDAYQAADKIVCDSRILSALANRHGIDLPVVPGSDLTATLFRKILKLGDRVAIIGGNQQLLDALQVLFPLPTYLHHAPPMGLLGNQIATAELVDFVRLSKAHYVLFAVGAPQSEIAALLCKDQAGTTGVGLCIGASIEFLTGSKKRAPVWMQSLKMEWLFRLLAEPRRLGARYVLGAFKLAKIYWRWRRGHTK
jgi:N-acetylglucosaminyldiphosphoundecaprenol N-acetyl-beta-D-mannosaminyltransferase